VEEAEQGNQAAEEAEPQPAEAVQVEEQGQEDLVEVTEADLAVQLISCIYPDDVK
jgi:hypothetical protein